MSAESIYSSRWSVSDTSTFDSNSLRMPFAPGDGLRRVSRRQRSRNIMGDRIHRQGHNRKGMQEYAGSIPIDPSPKFLGWALPRVMGGGSETAPAFGFTPTTFYMLTDRGTNTTTALGQCYKYGPCMIDSLELTCRGGLLSSSINVVALAGVGDQTFAGGTFAGASVATLASYTPYHYADWVLNADSFNWHVLDFTLRVTNNVTVRYNTGSREPQAHLVGERMVTLTGTATLDVDDYGDYSNADPELTGTLTGTNGTISTAFSFPSMLFDGEHVVGGEGEFIYPFSVSLAGTTGAEFTVANDVTP